MFYTLNDIQPLDEFKTSTKINFPFDKGKYENNWNYNQFFNILSTISEIVFGS